MNKLGWVLFGTLAIFDASTYGFHWGKVLDITNPPSCAYDKRTHLVYDCGGPLRVYNGYRLSGPELTFAKDPYCAYEFNIRWQGGAGFSAQCIEK